MSKKQFAEEFLRRQILPVLVMVLVVFGFRDAVADWYDVPSGSMLPTLRIGDRIAVDKLAYDMRVPFTDLVLHERGAPRPGEIVTLASPADGTRLVKRVVAVAGQRIAMRDGRLWIDGDFVARDPIPGDVYVDDMPRDMKHLRAYRETLGERDHVVLDMIDVASTPDFGPLVVPPDHVVVMGDNRDRSGDSRAFGFVPVETIEGRVVGVAFSLAHDENGDFAWRLRMDRFARDPDTES